MASHPDASDWSEWTTEDLIEMMKGLNKGLEGAIDIFHRKEIKGKDLPTLTDKRLEEEFKMIREDRIKVLSFINDTIGTRKAFMDPIHGSIDLHPLCVKVVDTPQFQRLRFLKQLGGGYFVYPGASHNRFEHSLGVCYLAGQLLRAIQQRQPELEITEIDILCVEIAGLCHDLGHGPFSHLFDKWFIPTIDPEEKWKHEKASADMISYMLEDRPKLKEDFKKFGLSDSHIEFIKELITGENNTEKAIELKKSLKGKEFLRQIVANKRNGIDVDKWDYFTRDSHMLGLKNSFDYTRSLQLTRVIGTGENQEICTRDKEAVNMYEMYHTRWLLHYMACQHRVTNVIEHMITEALIKANDCLKFEGKEGEKKMSESIHDMKAYCQLTDNVFWQILHYPLKELEKLEETDKKKMNDAQEILQKVLDRKLYPFVGETHFKNGEIIDKTKIKEMENEIFRLIEQKDAKIRRDDIVILAAYFDYGKEGRNPLEDVHYYSKSKPNESFKIKKEDVSFMLTENFAEQRLRVHSKVSDQDAIDMIRKAFKECCNQNGYRIPKRDSSPAKGTCTEG